jgi:hypothetical protein
VLSGVVCTGTGSEVVGAEKVIQLRQVQVDDRDRVAADHGD